MPPDTQQTSASWLNRGTFSETEQDNCFSFIIIIIIIPEIVASSINKNKGSHCYMINTSKLTREL